MHSIKWSSLSKVKEFYAFYYCLNISVHVVPLSSVQSCKRLKEIILMNFRNSFKNCYHIR